MKVLFCIVAALTAWCTCLADDNGFTTRFEFTGMPDSTRFVVRIHDGDNFRDWRFDTVYMVNGKAELHGISKAKDPVRAFVFTDYGTITLFVQNGHTELISGDKDDIEKETFHLEGAPWSEDLMDYNREIVTFTLDLLEKGRRFQSMTDSERSEYRELCAKADSIEKQFYLNHPNSWETLFLMESYYMMQLPKEELGKLYDQLLPEQRNSCYGTAIKQYLDVKSIKEGDSLDDFNIIATDQNGNLVNLKELKEPYILLDFSQLYCGPCKAATKEIHEIKEKYADKVAFINLSCDDSEEDWKKSVERDNITWPSLYAGGSKGDICLKYNVGSYPIFFLFGPDRTLLNTAVGYGKGMLDNYLSNFVNNNEH